MASRVAPPLCAPQGAACQGSRLWELGTAPAAHIIAYARGRHLQGRQGHACCVPRCTRGSPRAWQAPAGQAGACMLHAPLHTRQPTRVAGTCRTGADWVPAASVARPRRLQREVGVCLWCTWYGALYTINTPHPLSATGADARPTRQVPSMPPPCRCLLHAQAVTRCLMASRSSCPGGAEAGERGACWEAAPGGWVGWLPLLLGRSAGPRGTGAQLLCGGTPRQRHNLP